MNRDNHMELPTEELSEESVPFVRDSRPLGRILMELERLSSERLEEALVLQRTSSPRRRLGSLLSALGWIESHEIAEALSLQFGTPLVELSTGLLDTSLADLLPRRIATMHQAVPAAETDEGVLIAMADPSNLLAIDDLSWWLKGKKFIVGIAAPEEIKEGLQRLYGVESSPGTMDDVIERAAGSYAPDPDLEELQRATEEAPVVQLVHGIFSQAAAARATDIHIEPRPADVLVRFRIDGLLSVAMTLPKKLQSAVLSRVKVVAGMDIAERRRPQDGRTRIDLGDVLLDGRVSTIPTLLGEKVVIRLLRSHEKPLGLDELGMEPDELDLFTRYLDRPQGLLLLTGPTGSGKTTTLYACLQRLSSPETNITSLEDPIEYQIAGVNQMQVLEVAGITFAKGLRSILRQDPDIVMVGEIRDAETAEISMQAAHTGHLVLTTVHANSSPSAITRLIDLGVDPRSISSSLSLVIAQRLLRRVCEYCAVSDIPSEETLQRLGIDLEELSPTEFKRGAGCAKCRQTGFLGRVGIYEMLDVSMKGSRRGGQDMVQSAVAGQLHPLRTLTENGIRKAARGVTNLSEVLRVAPGGGQ